MFRSHFGYDTEAASKEAVVVNDQPSLTVQSMAEDADLNVLMERMKVTGKFPENPRPMTFGDFDEIFDYRTALHAVMDARDRFAEFPARVRARFENDPQKMLEFFADARNMDEARSLGLLKESSRGVSGGGSVGAGAGAGQSASGAGAPQPGAAGAAQQGAGGGQAPAGAGAAAGSGAS